MIQDIYKQSELSLAAYAELNSSTLSLQKAKLIDAGFSSKQADKFSDQYGVVTQYNDTLAEGGLGTSFSATVFKDTDGNLTLAIRGTLESGDFVPTDANILTEGTGYDQIVAMYNWWQRVSNPIGQSVPQYTIEFGSALLPAPTNSLELYSAGLGAINYYLVPLASVSATGELASSIAADSDQKLEVVGHSLGGHLAMAFESLFRNDTSAVTTFNAPGFTSTQINQDFFARLNVGREQHYQCDSR